MHALFQKMGLGPRCCMSNGLPGDAAGPLFVVKGWPSDPDSLASNSLFFFTYCLVVSPHSVTEITPANVTNDPSVTPTLRQHV